MRHTCADRRADLHVSPCTLGTCAHQALILDVSTYHSVICAKYLRQETCRFGTDVPFFRGVAEPAPIRERTNSYHKIKPVQTRSEPPRARHRNTHRGPNP